MKIWNFNTVTRKCLATCRDSAEHRALLSCVACTRLRGALSSVDLNKQNCQQAEDISALFREVPVLQQQYTPELVQWEDVGQEQT